MTNYVNSYGWENPNTPKSSDYLTPAILKILEDINVTRCCDLGSGNGALAGMINKAGYYICGVEYDEDGTIISKHNYPDINFYHLGVQDDPNEIIDSEGDLFDAIISTEVIEHLFSPHLLPIFARALLKSDGYLIVSTPYHGYIKNLTLSVFNKWDKHHTALWHGGHIKFWSQKTLTQLLEKNGFKVISFHGAGRIPYLWKSMILVAKAI